MFRHFKISIQPCVLEIKKVLSRIRFIVHDIFLFINSDTIFTLALINGRRIYFIITQKIVNLKIYKIALGLSFVQIYLLFSSQQ